MSGKSEYDRKNSAKYKKERDSITFEDVEKSLEKRICHRQSLQCICVK